MKYLNEESLLEFDIDFRDWPKYKKILQEQLTLEEPKRLLDVGGGNGLFMDNLLELYPDGSGVVMDYSNFMLEKNIASSKKTLKKGSATELHSLFRNDQFDLITINVLLHHLVADTEETTKENVVSCLAGAKEILAFKGRIFVYEQFYDKWFPGPEPSRLIYLLTRIKFRPVAKWLRKFGANTAGVGVRFRSRKNWKEIFKETELTVVAERFIKIDKPSLIRRSLLNIGCVGSYLYVLQSSKSESSSLP